MQHSAMMDEKDVANTILCDLKRVTREYTTAATESVCEDIRQMFTDLLQETLQLQGELYYMMKKNNLFTTPSPVLQKEVQQHIKTSQQTQEKTAQLVNKARS